MKGRKLFIINYTLFIVAGFPVNWDVKLPVQELRVKSLRTPLKPRLLGE